jgi:ribonuclease PH
MTREDGRRPDQLRDVRIETGIQKDPQGSVQIAFGDTVVLCAAAVMENVPGWLQREERKQGWITAEYAMLPGATPGRSSRRSGGRGKEIQRLIGRSLRAAADLEALGERTVMVDCDVIQADGGTRTASITGGWVALELAMRWLVDEGLLERSPVTRPVCAVSCGVLGESIVLDPDYQEDSSLDVDMNIVMAGDGKIIELQGTAEGEPFSREQLGQMLDLARAGAESLFEAQRKVLG